MKKILLLFTFLFLITACKVESSVSVNVEDDGTGSVEVSVGLDNEASRLIGDIEKQLRTEDLVSSGWEVSLSEGLEEKTKIVVSASKNFTSPTDISAALRAHANNDKIRKNMSVCRLHSKKGGDLWVISTNILVVAESSTGLVINYLLIFGLNWRSPSAILRRSCFFAVICNAR